MGSSSGNFTDYAAAQRGPADSLRGSTSYPIHVRNSLRPPESLSSSELHSAEGVPQSPRMERNAQLMTRSQSLALPNNMELEASRRSASHRHSYKRSEIASRSQRQLASKAMSDDSGLSPRQPPQQQKGEKALQKRSITKDQNIEPGKAMWAGLAAVKEGVLGGVNSPKSGSGLIKVGLGFEEEGGC